jgi:hypothetical protein
MDAQGQTRRGDLLESSKKLNQVSQLEADEEERRTKGFAGLAGIGVGLGQGITPRSHSTIAPVDAPDQPGIFTRTEASRFVGDLLREG